MKACQILADFPRDKHIVDLGAGQGTDTSVFLQDGWTVIAVDTNPIGLWLCKRKARKAGLNNKLSCIQSWFEDYTVPACAGVNASFALPFCAREHWPDLWDNITTSIISGGVFAGQFFGREDSWGKYPLNNNPTLHFSEQEVRTLFEGFDILDFKEVKQQGKGPCGEKKHWHVYHVVARKN